MTVTADLDLYLDLGERQVIADWILFDRSVLRYAQDSAATDANGILLMDADFVFLERLQKTDDTKIDRIEIEDRARKNGYYFAGWNTAKTQRQIQVMEGSSGLASTTLEFHALKLNLMGTAASSESVIPEEFREMISVKASQIWYEDQGPALASIARHWEGIYGSLPDERQRHGTGWLGRAWRSYRSVDDEPVFAQSLDPDAGGGFSIEHLIT